MAATSEKSPRRYRFVFRLRTLMIVVLLVALFPGWRANRAYTQKRLVAQIKAAKGSITYDFQVFRPGGSPGIRKKPAAPPGPDWLRNWIGDEYFQEVAGVTFRGPVTAETMEAISRLDRLESIEIGGPLKVGDGLEKFRGSSYLRVVRLSGPAVNDAWLATLANCPNLDRLELNGADVSDAGLAQLTGLTRLASLGVVNSPKVTDATVENLIPFLTTLNTLNLGSSLTDRSLPTLGRMKNLKYLVLSRSRVTDRGIASLRELTGLVGLYLEQTAVTDDGLASLSELTNLQQLNLGETRVTGVGFKSLDKLQKLAVIDLNGSDFSDEGMPFLSKLNGLKTVYLERTKITDAGLIPLQGMPKLARLFVSGSKVTASGLAALKQTKPSINAMDKPEPRPVTSAPQTK